MSLDNPHPEINESRRLKSAADLLCSLAEVCRAGHAVPHADMDEEDRAKRLDSLEAKREELVSAIEETQSEIQAAYRSAPERTADATMVSEPPLDVLRDTQADVDELDSVAWSELRTGVKGRAGQLIVRLRPDVHHAIELRSVHKNHPVKIDMVSKGASEELRVTIVPEDRCYES